MKDSIRCLIVDDEPLAAELIQKHLEMIPQLELVGTCWNAIEASEFLQKHSVDLIFLDIQMPVLNGIAFIKSLPQKPSVIFTTAYREYAMDGYELDVVDYLLKPITFERFFRAVQKFIRRETPTNTAPSMPYSQSEAPESTSDSLYVNTNRKHVKISLHEVLFIESLKDYIRIHTPQKSVSTKEKISEFGQKLPPNFLRIHRSFIINLDKVTAYSTHEIEVGEHTIPIGISYKQKVLEHFRKE